MKTKQVTFRQIVKNKYREFLNRKDLEEMSKKLTVMQKNAKSKIIELQNKKKELIDNMIDGNLSDNNVLRSLSEDEIMNLLK